MGPLFTLMLVFADGYLGGTAPAAEFATKAACEKMGVEMVMQNANAGHPATFHCIQMPKYDTRYRPVTPPLPDWPH